LHDNAALVAAVESGDPVVPFFVLDPWFDRSCIGVNRFQFLLESLRDLDGQLREAYGSRLLVLQGRPDDVLQGLFEGTGPVHLKSLLYERDSEPYARQRDAGIEALARKCNVATRSFSGHTILDLDKVLGTPGFKPPISMAGIQALLKTSGPVPPALAAPRKLPPLAIVGFEVPDITELYGEEDRPTGSTMLGGEREALRRLAASCVDVAYVCDFEKPKTVSTGQKGKPWEPSTTGLSPYLKFGCISVRTAWHTIAACYEGRQHAQPPQSLHGQLLFREMFYVLGSSVPNWDKAEGNSMCKQIPWGEDKQLLDAWIEGRTGYPFIDALMRQLRTTGWMHHLGRHAVACFLTRGDLWQHWTAGRDIFDKYLLDSDWALNNGNWLWLAGVAPFSAPYFRIYDPCPGAKSSLNAEQSGEFVRHFVPELKAMPDKYIYTPWKAPVQVQQQARCVIGKDYPSPIVDHKVAREQNLAKFKAALERRPEGAAALPEKFGAGQKTDPGPMQTLHASAKKGADVPAKGAKGDNPPGHASTATKGGKSEGKGIGRFFKFAGATADEATTETGASSDVQPSTQRKRRWGPGSGVGKGPTSSGGGLSCPVQIDLSD